MRTSTSYKKTVASLKLQGAGDERIYDGNINGEWNVIKRLMEEKILCFYVKLYLGTYIVYGTYKVHTGLINCWVA